MFTWREAAGAPLASLNRPAIKAGKYSRGSASCLEWRAFPAALCRHFTAGVWLLLSLEGTDLWSEDWKEQGGHHARWHCRNAWGVCGFCTMKEQSVSPIQQQQNICLLVLLALFGLAFVSQWPAVQSALGMTQAWTISLWKGLLLGDMPVKLA